MFMTNQKFFLAAILVTAGVIIAGVFVLNLGQDETAQIAEVTSSEDTNSVSQETGDAQSEKQAVVFKQANCGCCNGYIAELKRQGFSVEVKPEKDMAPIKEKYGIPQDRQSCHTTVIGNYFIEGHVPIAAVEKLLSDKPAVDGIGLPGMPLGTPGMPGVKQAPYEVYQKIGNDFESFMTL